MSKLKKIKVEVFNVSHIDNKNYITSIEVPKYKHITKTMRFLKNYVKKQSDNDFKKLSTRFYVFKSDAFLIKETDLNFID